MKKTLRNQTIAAMKALPQTVRTQADEQLTQCLLELPAFQEAKTLATYLLPLALEFPQILGLSSLRLLLLGQKLAQPHQNEALHLREYVS